MRGKHTRVAAAGSACVTFGTEDQVNCHSLPLPRGTTIALAGVLAFFVAGADGTRAQSADTDAGSSASEAAPTLDLSAAQRGAIYDAVSKDRSKSAPKRFATAVGAEVPPMIELYALPDDILARNPATKLFEYTMVEDRVVLVDPTKMRVIAVIGPRR